MIIYTIAVLVSIIFALTALAFFKARDVYSMIHIVTICNFYIIPLLLIVVGIENFSLVSTGKILAIIVLNLLATQLLCHKIAQDALRDKIKPEADFKNST